MEASFIKAAEQRKRIELVDNLGRRRIAEPYMIYTTSKGKRCFHMYQIEGYSKRNKIEEWKNPETAEFALITVLQSSFAIRPQYNPDNVKMFPVIHFRLPKSLAANI